MATAETPPEAAMLELAAVFFLPRRCALNRGIQGHLDPQPDGKGNDPPPVFAELNPGKIPIRGQGVHTQIYSPR